MLTSSRHPSEQSSQASYCQEQLHKFSFSSQRQWRSMANDFSLGRRAHNSKGPQVNPSQTLGGGNVAFHGVTMGHEDVGTKFFFCDFCEVDFMKHVIK